MKKYKRSGDHYLIEISKEEYEKAQGEIMKHEGRFTFGVGESSNHFHIAVVDEYTKQTLKGNPVYYKLYKLPKGEIFTEDVKAMWYTCPSTGMSNFSGVPKEIEKVDEAMAWKGSDELLKISPEDWRNAIPLLDEA